MRLLVEVEDRVSEKLLELASSDLNEARGTLVDDAMKAVLERIVRLNPVDTGRSRSAWVRALASAGGSPPPGWRGPRPESGAIAEGASSGRLERVEGESTDEASATNSIRYVRYLEYGTSRMAPFAMVRRAIVQTVSRLGEMFQFPTC